MFYKYYNLKKISDILQMITILTPVLNSHQLSNQGEDTQELQYFPWQYENE